MNKNITRILALETFEIDFKDTWKVFQNKFAVGVSIWADEELYSFERIKVQGIHPDKIEAILIDNFCRPQKCVDHSAQSYIIFINWIKSLRNAKNA